MFSIRLISIGQWLSGSASRIFSGFIRGSLYGKQRCLSLLQYLVSGSSWSCLWSAY